MAVFTEVSLADARKLIEPLSIGELIGLRGIAQGIENSNFFLDTDRGQYVLTVFERLSPQQLPFYLDLMLHLASRGVPVPRPQTTASGHAMFELRGKPCAVVNKLQGSQAMQPDVSHVRQMGATMARMHLAVKDFGGTQPNLRGLTWWNRVVPEIEPLLSSAKDSSLRPLIRQELQAQNDFAATPLHQALPRGAVHADLFRDNVMFVQTPEGPKLSGVFDFYFAGVDTFVFDLAVCLNDWCVDPDTGEWVEARRTALMQAYSNERPLLPSERQALPMALRAAAFRFWVSRLWDWHLPRQAQMLKAHDPTHFERVLRLRRREAVECELPWHTWQA